MKENLIGKAKIKDGAVVGVDFSFVTWKDNGEIFDVYTFNEDRKKLVADGYGNLDKPNAYGSGALFVKNTDVIFYEATPVTTPTEPISAYSGFSKIEPLGRYYSHDDIINKLNEVIERQNRIIDYLNEMVKK